MFGFKNVTVSVTAILAVYLIGSCEGLKDGQPGVCVGEVSKIITKLMTTTDKKICKSKKTCTVKIRYKENTKKPICCLNYELIEKDDICVPLCKFGCTSGTCIAPNKCHCEPPLILVNHTCVAPTCDEPCINSRCVGIDTCECNENFVPINATYCAPVCPSGYFRDSIECKPKCDITCVNGTCTEPNICTCNPGHKLKEGDYFTCVPKCTPSCLNADCTDPDVCSCFEGYIPENKWKCKPVCDQCENGDCLAPNICKCRTGYSKKDGICTPNCDQPCSNGTCIKPNKCKCDSGYEPDPANNFDCVPICEPHCINATCVSPYTCSCLFGYEKTGNNWACKPICKQCNNGECIAPNNCRCLQGYSKKADKCTPNCDRPCKNGFCSEPNVCSCDAGFRLNNTDKFTCSPICEPKCVNASCVSPNKCECLTGFEPTNNTYVCKPKCKSCRDGHCISPNVCQCHEGYNMISEVCSPICVNPCVNGYCSSPNKCTCKEGYLNSTEQFICHKPCKQSCNNGKCSIDGECICDRGYELNNNTCTTMKSVTCNECPDSVSHNCTDTTCWCKDGRPCLISLEIPEEVASSVRLAGLEMTWMYGGAVCLLLIVLVMAVILRMWHKRKDYGNKTTDDGMAFGSVIYTRPHTLVTNKLPEDNIPEDDYYEEVAMDSPINIETSERLLTLKVEENDNA